MKGPELRLAILKYGLVILGSLIFHWLTHSLARSTLLGSLMTLLHGVMILSLGCRLLITVRDVPPEATVTTKDDLFFVVRDAYSPNITPQQVAWYFVKGRLLWNICEDITSPFLWGHIHQKNCSSCQYPQPPNDLPRTTLPSREVFGETPDFAAFQTLVDSVFFFLEGGGVEYWKYLEPGVPVHFFGAILGPLHNLAQKWLKRTPADAILKGLFTSLEFSTRKILTWYI